MLSNDFISFIIYSSVLWEIVQTYFQWIEKFISEKKITWVQVEYPST